jgi:hypothetical protein
MAEPSGRTARDEPAPFPRTFRAHLIVEALDRLGGLFQRNRPLLQNCAMWFRCRTCCPVLV